MVARRNDHRPGHRAHDEAATFGEVEDDVDAPVREDAMLEAKAPMGPKAFDRIPQHAGWEELPVGRGLFESGLHLDVVDVVWCRLSFLKTLPSPHHPRE